MQMFPTPPKDGYRSSSLTTQSIGIHGSGGRNSNHEKRNDAVQFVGEGYELTGSAAWQMISRESRKIVLVHRIRDLGRLTEVACVLAPHYSLKIGGLDHHMGEGVRFAKPGRPPRVPLLLRAGAPPLG